MSGNLKGELLDREIKEETESLKGVFDAKRSLDLAELRKVRDRISKVRGKIIESCELLKQEFVEYKSIIDELIEKIEKAVVADEENEEYYDKLARGMQKKHEETIRAEIEQLEIFYKVLSEFRQKIVKEQQLKRIKELLESLGRRLIEITKEIKDLDKQIVVQMKVVDKAIDDFRQDFNDVWNHIAAEYSIPNHASEKDREDLFQKSIRDDEGKIITDKAAMLINMIATVHDHIGRMLVDPGEDPKLGLELIKGRLKEIDARITDLVERHGGTLEEVERLLGLQGKRRELEIERRGLAAKVQQIQRDHHSEEITHTAEEVLSASGAQDLFQEPKNLTDQAECADINASLLSAQVEDF